MPVPRKQRRGFFAPLQHREQPRLRKIFRHVIGLTNQQHAARGLRYHVRHQQLEKRCFAAAYRGADRNLPVRSRGERLDDFVQPGGDGSVEQRRARRVRQRYVCLQPIERVPPKTRLEPGKEAVKDRVPQLPRLRRL